MKLKETGYSAEQLKEIVNKYMIETYERFDFIADSADGMYLFDEEGERYLDFYGGVAVNSVGNCNKKVVEAVKDQVGDIMHTFNYPYTVPQALLAKTICETTGMDKVMFQNSGTEANECMIKMARKYGVETIGPEKYHIIAAKSGFHGRTFGAMAATGQPESAIQKGFGAMVPGFTYAEFNNLDDFASQITDKTIGILIEPVQAEGGVYPATETFMKGLRRLCDEHGLLLMLDEVQTGWCRTGTVMAYQRYGVKPDLVSIAKAMGGGMPIGACLAKQEVAQVFGTGTHGSTYAGNPVACAAAYAAISELLEKDMAAHAEEMGRYFMERLNTLPHVKEVRGSGLLVGVEFDLPLSVSIKHVCLEHRLLITAIGDSIVRMVPPLILTKDHINQAVETLEQSIKAAARHYQDAA